MAGVEVSSKSMVASTVASSSTLSSRPPRVTNPWRDAAQDLAGDPGMSATKHTTCRQLGGQARGTERQHPLPPASGGLVDLATVLGKRAEDRDALLAVVAALARVDHGGARPVLLGIQRCASWCDCSRDPGGVRSQRSG